MTALPVDKLGLDVDTRGRDVMNSGMWRVYLQNSHDVRSTLVRARGVRTGSGLISSAGAANIADGF